MGILLISLVFFFLFTQFFFYSVLIPSIQRNNLIFFSLLNGLIETGEINVGRHLAFVVENNLLRFGQFGTIRRRVGCFRQRFVGTIGVGERNSVTLGAVQP